MNRHNKAYYILPVSRWTLLFLSPLTDLTNLLLFLIICTINVAVCSSFCSSPVD